MLLHYLKVAVRTLARNKGYTFITVAGLGLGLACCLLVALYVRDELSYDAFHARADRIYRVTLTSARDGAEARYATTPLVLAPTLAGALPGLEATVRFYGRSVGMEVAGEGAVGGGQPARFREDRFFFADTTVFEVFTFPLVRGDPRQALRRAGSLVLTRAMARKYFGDEAAAMGRTLLVEGRHPFTVTGVLGDLPHNTHLRFDFLASFDDLFAMEREDLRDYLRTDWYWNPAYTYVLLAPGVPAARLAGLLRAFMARHTEPSFAEGRQFHLQPLRRIHLDSDFQGEARAQGNRTLVYLFSGIGLLARDFVGLVAVAFGLAVPVAWLVLRGWLSGFAYRVEPSWAVFALAGAAALVVALATVGYQSLRAAATNPADALRAE